MFKKSPWISILIPDGENELLTNHVKDSLARVPKVKLFVMSNKKFGPSRFSRYVHNYSYYPKSNNELDWIRNMNTEVLKHNIDLIMPVFEDGIRTLIKFKSKIQDNQKLVILPSLEKFTIANNKALLAKHLDRNNIPGPKIYEINKGNYPNVSENDFPILVKPLNRTDGGSGIMRFDHKKDFVHYFEIHNNEHNFIFQEYIDGFDIDCSVLCKEGEICAFTIQKGILYEAKKYAPPIGVEFVYNDELFLIVKKLMRTLNWSGVAHIDMRYDVNDSRFKVIEVNTRFWGSLDASLTAGVNFPYLYYLVTTGNKYNTSNYHDVEFLSKKGLIIRLKQDVLFLFNFKSIYKFTALKYLFKDPFPYFIKIITGLNYHISHFFKRKG